MSSPNPVRTRMAPSPTGDLHIGSLRTALYAYAYAKQNNGQFVIRIEDTDQKRLVEGAEQRTLQIFKDYHLDYDEGPDVGGPYGPYKQTQRLGIYNQYLKELLDKGGAYHCFCTEDRLGQMRQEQKVKHRPPKYDRHCLNLSQAEIDENLAKKVPHVIRLRVPDNQTISFDDTIRGKIEFNTNEVDDQVLVKSNGIPTYHFAVVIDDHLMEITHIMRGDEWISSTPKQIILYDYFGWEKPEFCHLTVLLDPTHPGKMSKRFGSVFASQFLNDGYLPEAMLNFLMLLGWNPGTDQEIFTLNEFIKVFDLKHLHVKQPIFDRKKLDYFNGLYIRQKTNSELVELLKPFLPKADDKTLLFLAPLLKERLVKLSDATTITRYLFEKVDYSTSLFTDKKLELPQVKEFILETKNILSTADFNNVEKLKELLMTLITSHNWHTGKFFMAFRIAIAGSPITPPIVETLPLLGRNKTIALLDYALSLLN